MKIKQSSLAALLAIVAFGATAQTAQRAAKVAPERSAVTAEIGYATLDYTKYGYSAKPSVVRGLFSYEANTYMAIEGMVAFGAESGTLTGAGTTAQLKVDQMVGIYLKPKTKLSQNLELFGRLGYATKKLTATASGMSASSTEEAETSYGVGLSYALWPQTTVNVDYMSYYDKDQSKLKGINVGLGFRF